MKLTKELKQRIDNYFDNISAEDLYEISINKYRMSQVYIELDNVKFNSIGKSFYFSDLSCMTYENENKDLCDISLAA